MSQHVTVIDYGMGNLFSVRRAFEEVGASVSVAETVEQIQAADCLVLPGVGAFADGMSELKGRGFDQPIKAFARSDRPLLGICLGMQMMMTISEEFGEHEGLDIIAGKAVEIPAKAKDGLRRKIPHIGWNVVLPDGKGISDTVQPTDKHDPSEMSYYFVHSFAVMPSTDAHCLAHCFYDGIRIPAIIRSGMTVGCQFHPEKSGKIGLAFLKRWLNHPDEILAA